MSSIGNSICEGAEVRDHSVIEQLHKKHGKEGDNEETGSLRLPRCRQGQDFRF